MDQKADFVPVLLGADGSAYGMARSFYEEYGVVSQALSTRVYPICQNSDIVKAAEVPQLDQDAEFVRTLRSFSERSDNVGKTLLLVPTEHRFARLLARHADQLPQACRFNNPSLELVEQLETKDRFYAVCQKHDLPFPPFMLIAHPDDMVGCPFGFPAILKPDDPDAFLQCAYRGKKNLYEIRSETELNYALSMAGKAGYARGMILQQEIPGDDDAITTLTCYSAQDGQVRLVCPGDVILEESAPWNMGHYGAVIAGENRELADRVIAFLDRIGYTGFCNIDLKYDPEQDVYAFLDFNFAPCDSSYLATAAGRNLARFVVEDVLEDAPGPRVEVESDSALLTPIPESTIRQYARDLESWPRVDKMIRSKKMVELFVPDYDKNFKRWKTYRSDQHFHRREFADCYGRNHIND